MIHAELYLQPGDVQRAVRAIKRIQKNKKKPQDGIESLLAAVAVELGFHFSGNDLFYAHCGAVVRTRNHVNRLIEHAKKMVANGWVHSSHINYNDLDDNLWAHIEETSESVEFPWFEKWDKPEERNANGKRTVIFPKTRYTIYHESHGHCYIFFIQENIYLDEHGKRCVSSHEMAVRKWDDVKNNFKKVLPSKLWEDNVRYNDSRDPNFVCSYKYEPARNGFSEETSCEATQWFHNIDGELQHFDAIVADKDL